jgi:HK97 family phage major capsid protein
MDMIFDESSLYGMTDLSPTESNSVTLQVDETTPWATSGVRVYTRGEAQAMTQSKLALKDHTTKLNEVYAFVPMTDELLEDAPLLSSHLTKKAGQALGFKLSEYVFSGTGVGQPLGILNSPALVTQAAVGSQTADTIHADNIIAMWGRMVASVRGSSVWIVNQDAEAQLMKLGLGVVPATSTTPIGGMPIYLPPGGLSASPYGTLLGRPVVTTELGSALGDVGDIVLAYMPGYFSPYKARGVKSDVSMHLYFDQGVTSFRWTYRMGGQPYLSAPITRKNGSNTLSHFVTLAAR